MDSRGQLNGYCQTEEWSRLGASSLEVSSILAQSGIMLCKHTIIKCNHALQHACQAQSFWTRLHPDRASYVPCSCTMHDC